MSLEKGVGVRERDLPWVDIQVRPGYKQRYQGFFDKARGLGARIGSLYAEPYYHSPRHRHTFQQVRYVLSGQMKYGPDIYGPGDCLYLPEGVAYGPIKPVATEGDEQLHFVDIQFMGPSGIPYPTPDEVLCAQRALAETGVFAEGVYNHPDGRKRDAYEAILEHLMGGPVNYPTVRLTNYTVMRTSSYPAIAHATLPGLRQKHLGFFFESGPNLKLLSLASGASIPAGKAVGHRALFLISGDVTFDGEAYEALSYFVFPSEADHAALRASSDATILALGWTAPGAVLPFELF